MTKLPLANKKTIMKPVPIPSRLKGKVTLRKVLTRLAPRIRALSSSCKSILRSTDAMERTIKGTSTWTRPTTAELALFRNINGLSRTSIQIRKSLTNPRRAKRTRQPNVRMMMEVSSGAMRRKIMKPYHFPECRTRNIATG